MNKVDKKRYEDILKACKSSINNGINIVKQSVGSANGGYRASYRKTAHPLYALLISIEDSNGTPAIIPYRRRAWRRMRFGYSYGSDYASFKNVFDKLKKKRRIPVSWMVGFDYGLNYSYFRDKIVDHKSILEKMTYHVYKNHYGLTKKQISSWAKNKRDLSSFKRGFAVGELISKDIKDPSLKDVRAKKSLRSSIRTALKAKVSQEDIKEILNECLIEEVLST